MKNRTYWSYSHRHSFPPGRITPGQVVLRLLDRLDDGLVGLAAGLEYRRIECMEKVRQRADSRHDTCGSALPNPDKRPHYPVPVRRNSA